MTKNIIKLSNEEINNLAMEYRATNNEDTFVELYEAVKPLAHKLAYKYYHKYSSIAGKEEFVNVAEFTIWDVIADYDAAKGEYFTARLKRAIGWKISDSIVRPYYNKSEEFNREVLSLDKPLGSDEGTFLDAVEHRISKDLLTYAPASHEDSVADTVIANEEDDAAHTEASLSSILTDLVEGFSADATEDDKAIIATWVTTVLHTKDASKKDVNNAIAAVMPEVTSATLRKKKSRAVSRFNDYAKETGFPSFDLSQF